MKIREETIAKVVAEVSKGGGNPRYVEQTVGSFMRQQHIVGNYISAHEGDLGVEGVVLVLLHASVLLRAVEREAGAPLPVLNPSALDAAAQKPPSAETFAAEQPAIADYLGANVGEDGALAQAKQRNEAMSLLRVVAQALVGGGAGAFK